MRHRLRTSISIPTASGMARWRSVSYTFLKDVVPQIDARNSIYYMAAGNYPAMMDENVGQGCRLRTICPSWWIKRRPHPEKLH